MISFRFQYGEGAFLKVRTATLQLGTVNIDHKHFNFAAIMQQKHGWWPGRLILLHGCAIVCTLELWFNASELQQQQTGC